MTELRKVRPAPRIDPRFTLAQAVAAAKTVIAERKAREAEAKRRARKAAHK